MINGGRTHLRTGQTSKITIYSWSIKDANTKLADVKAQESEMATSIADQAKDQRSLTNLFNSDGVSVSSAISGLKERLAAIKSFQSNINKLSKAGFSKEIIAEVAAAGPEQGATMAQELLNATKTQVKEFNDTYAAIGTASTSLGKSVASTYYATGKKAAQALVDGLMADDKKLTKAIDKLAANIEKKFKSKLKISSKTPVDSSLATLLTWLTGQGQAVKGGGSTSKKKTTRTSTTYSTDSKGRKVTTVTTTTTDPAKGTTTTVTKRTVGGKTTTSTKVSKIKGYATGTRSAARGLALVGERGTELVDFKGGERVYNAKETARMMGPRYEIHIHEAKAENTTQSVLRALHYAETMAAL
ncbi:peptidase M23 [Streptomyces sp. NPDC014622]|uniref:peptidase M23 n=1 Tax=Streptomyces sp. NPDC014622 TaxID=3364874 RepID=UPI0036F73D0F